MPKSREVVSLDIGNDSIKGIVVDFSEGYGNVLAFSNVKTRGIENGEIKDVVALNESMTQIIEDLEDQLGKELKGELLVSSSCGDFTLTEITEELILTEKEEAHVSEEHVMKLTDNLLADLFPNNERNSLHLFVKKYVLDDNKIVVNPIGMKARKLRQFTPLLWVRKSTGTLLNTPQKISLEKPNIISHSYQMPKLCFQMSKRIEALFTWTWAIITQR